MMFRLFIFIVMLTLAKTSFAAPVNDTDFAQSLQSLTQKSFNKKSIALKEISEQDHPQILPILEALLSNNLYYLKSNKLVIIIDKSGDKTTAMNAATTAAIDNFSKSSAKKIGVNNKLRKQLRTYIAQLSLQHSDPQQRLIAAKNLRENPSAENIRLLENALLTESDEGVKEIMFETLNISKALDTNADQTERLAAIKALEGALSNDARNALQKLAALEEDGSPVYAPEISKAATASYKQIENSLQFYSIAETAFFGLSLGSVLLLAAIGLAITFGVMGVINMAHGEMMMIGAYTVYVMQLIMPNFITTSLWIAIPMAFLVSAIVGILMERLVIRHLYGRPLETLLATFGISLVLQQLVRTIFSPLNKEVITPEFMTGSLQINEALSFTYNRLYIIIFALIVFAAVLYIMKKTTLGLQVRAVTQNRQMAKAMGIKTDRIDMITFGLGSGLAGIAGVALSQLTNVGPNLGQAYIVDAFMVVVFGGVGNLWGTLIAAFTLGELTKLIEPIQGAVLAKVIILVLIILFIQKRPRGLFPQKGRDAES